MIQSLLNEIASHGNKGAIVPISRIDDLKQDMEDLKNSDYHTGFIDWRAGSVDKFMPTGLDFEPRSIISALAPCPQVVIQFVYHGNPVECLLPPTYTTMNTASSEVLLYINNFLKPSGFKAGIADQLPEKLLAVHCGLGKYGRNNICYNDTFGSYMRILTYVSDLPCGHADWFPIKRMDACEKCHACVMACPTRAIASDHNVINADVCLTSINEHSGAFPDWIDKGAHNSLVGCMKCQSCCPQNRCNRNNTEIGVSFTEAETTELLEHKEGSTYSDMLMEKIKTAGITTYAQVLPRNLAALLHI